MDVLKLRGGPRLVTVVVTAALLSGATGTSAPDLTADAPGTHCPTSFDAPMTSKFLGGEWGDDTTDEAEDAASSGEWRADKDQGSLYWITKRYGAQQAWTQDDPYGRKVTGKGVTVAVIDTGIAPVEGLSTFGKVVNGPDLSFESQTANTRYLDGYGHGTHMAGIIAGRDRHLSDGSLDDAREFVGVAPGAKILNMKVGTADGGADVSQVIAAVDWIVQHRKDNGMNVRVINLSYGTPSSQSYLLDPLAHAVENAWRAGIVVVAAAGNEDKSTTRLTMPAADPYVIAVGAVDHLGTPDQRDDVVADFSNGGSTARRPDLLAPGKSVVSLRVPGSLSDVEHPEGRIADESTGRSFRGSGTSQAAAVVSGAAALLLQARPSLSPDQLKLLLTRTADPLVQNPEPAMGAGVLDIKEAMGSATPPALWARQTWPISTGLGTLEDSRGVAHVVDPANGAVLTGEIDALGNPWVATSWSAASSDGAAWHGGAWNGADWSGTQWSARSWSGAAWEARSWSARSWSGIDWLARSWSDDTWAARSWSASDWLARSWSNDLWGARSWSGGRN